jgi:hypothetical protein
MRGQTVECNKTIKINIGSDCKLLFLIIQQILKILHIEVDQLVPHSSSEYEFSELLQILLLKSLISLFVIDLFQ